VTNLPAKTDEALLPTTFEGMLAQAEVLVKSGLLPKTVRTAAAAVAIMLTGRELGIPPMQSFRSIYVVDGKPTISTELMAALLLEAGVTYNIDKLTEAGCQITFKRANGMHYTSVFTAEDAKRAGLMGKDNWRSYPRDMLYNRAFATGARKIAPDVLAKLYTPDELGAVEVLDETGDLVAVQIADQPPSEPEPQAIAPEPNGKTWTQADRPYPPRVIAKALRQAAAARGDKPASEKQRLATRLALDALFAEDGRAPQKRRVLTQYVYGVESSADLTSGQCGALLDWARITEEDETGQKYYTPTEHAPAEAAAIVEAALEEPDEE